MSIDNAYINVSEVEAGAPGAVSNDALVPNEQLDLCENKPFSELPYVVGFNVERLRRAQGISKIRFCQMLGIGRPTLDRIEDGEGDCRLSLLEALAVALETSVPDLLQMPQHLSAVNPQRTLARRKAERRARNAGKSPANRQKKQQP